MGVTSETVLIDTDLGDDIDDTWALAHALRCAEFRVSYVLTAGHGDHAERARIAQRLLDTAGAPPDVAIGLGCVTQTTGGRRYMFQEGWAGDVVAIRRQVHEDGVGHLIKIIHEAVGPVTLLAIGPLDNIIAALQRDPSIASRCHFVSMLGSVFKGYDGKDGRTVEFNVRQNPAACRNVLAAPWLSRTLAPLDSAGVVVLEGRPYRCLLESAAPLAQCIVSAYKHWLDAMPEARQRRLGLTTGHTAKTSVLFDCVAVHLCRGATARRQLDIHQLRLDVTHDGYTLPTDDPSAPSVDVAISWHDLTGFINELVDLFTAIPPSGMATDIGTASSM